MKKLLSLSALLLVSAVLWAAEPYWTPYAFKGTEHFKYTLTQKDPDGTVTTGSYVIDIQKQGDKYRIHFEGKFGDSEGSFTTTTEDPKSVGGMLLFQTMMNPWLAPLTATLFAQFFGTFAFSAVTLGNWEVGTISKFKDDQGNTVEYAIPDECSYAGQTGRHLVVKTNGQVQYELCVAKGIALPLYQKMVNDEGGYTELELVEYSE